MRNFSELYKEAKANVIAKNKAVYEDQKLQICEALKEEYMIVGKISELPQKKQQDLMEKLLNYWSPKTGITAAGEKYLAEGVICINEKSSSKDIKRYIIKETKKNHLAIEQAFMNGRGSYVVESFKNDVESKIGKVVKENVIRDLVWGTISENIKNL